MSGVQRRVVNLILAMTKRLKTNGKMLMHNSRLNMNLSPSSRTPISLRIKKKKTNLHRTSIKLQSQTCSSEKNLRNNPLLKHQQQHPKTHSTSLTIHQTINPNNLLLPVNLPQVLAT